MILCEILDTQTKALMPIAKVTDNLLSNEIISSCLSLVSEDPYNNDILSELLQPEGNDIKMNPSLDYGEQGESISLWELSARVRARGEILLGYKMSDAPNSCLNPLDKTVKISLNVRTSLIIMSETICSVHRYQSSSSLSSLTSQGFATTNGTLLGSTGSNRSLLSQPQVVIGTEMLASRPIHIVNSALGESSRSISSQSVTLDSSMTTTKAMLESEEGTTRTSNGILETEGSSRSIVSQTS